VRSEGRIAGGRGGGPSRGAESAFLLCGAVRYEVSKLPPGVGQI